jgi:two-component system chemotaxis response regulator CheY
MAERNMATILIADDSLLTRRIITRIATGLNHTIAGEAENGLETIEKYKELSPDMITLDITMPVMDGLECLNGLIELNPMIKVLIVSAIGKSSMVLEALKRGAKYYVTKPLNEKLLADAIRITLEDDSPPPDKSAFY